MEKSNQLFKYIDNNKYEKKENKTYTEAQKPKLNKSMDHVLFQKIYWMKKELEDFCKENKLMASGRKEELTERIRLFLKDGKITEKKKAKPNRATADSNFKLTRNSLVKNYLSDNNTREFFKKEIGDHFHFTQQLNLFRENAIENGIELTYGDLINEWKKQYKLKKDPAYKCPISNSCEYNKFIRDYYEANPRVKWDTVRLAWNEAKTYIGPHTYDEYVKRNSK
ncbi:MAG TPA: DUF6434 domain-containing protein [Burkholderiales bacterium]|nr:DUF6434 domain-containing protein [Burkholderiales bacterium]